MEYDLRQEAKGFAEAYLKWAQAPEGDQWNTRQADIFRNGPGDYRLIMSGCGVSGVHHIVYSGLTSDLFGDVDADTTVEQLAELLVDAGFMADMLTDWQEE